MHTRDLKSLNNTIASVTKPIDDRRQALQEGYINSLTEKARQVISESENERGEKEDMDDIIKRLAAKALKRAKKKAGKPSTDDDYAGANPKAAKTDPDMKNAGAVAEELIYEVAAPGYEDWASDPKVKASFKKQYGNRWKQVMYGHSWNMKKMDEAAELAEGSYVHSEGELKKAIKGSKKEIGKAYKKGDKKGMKFWMQNIKDAESQMKEEAELAEGVSAKRMRIIRKYLLSRKPMKREVKDFMDRSIKKMIYKNKQKFGGETSAVLGRAALKHSAMKAKGLAEAEQLDEIINFLKQHKRKINAALVGAALGAGAGVAAPHVRDHMPSNPVRTSLTDTVGLASHKQSPSLRAGVGAALGAGAMMVGVKRRRVTEAEQLDELSDNTLMRARWKAHLQGRKRLTGKIDNELIKRKLLAPPPTSMRARENQYVAHRDANRARLQAQGMHEEAEQLDEGKGGRSGFTNLMKRQVSRVRRAGGREDLQREIGNYTEREASSGESKMSYPARRAFSDADIEARIKARDAKKAKGLAEAEQLDEAISARAARENIKRDRTGIRPEPGVQKRLRARRERIAQKYGINPKNREAISALSRERRNTAMRAKGLDPIGARYESVQLDEAGYKRLMRLKKAAYKADLASRSSVLDPTDARSQGKKHSRLKRAAAEQESKVAARMAMKGGASAEAVRAGGSRIGKSGKYTQKAASLASNRDKGLRAFRNLVVDRGISRDTGVGPVKAMANRLQGEKPKMTPAQVAKKREAQAAMRDFRNRARSGDFGQNNQEGMRPRYNYLKRTGKLKTK